MIIAGIIALQGLSASVYAQHQWTNLDGPYWVNGIDVAYGNSGLGQAWHRYLFGIDGINNNMFYWGEGSDRWSRALIPLNTIDRLISYKQSGSGHYAFCTVYDDEIYGTTDGGVNWEPYDYSIDNKAFTTVEVINWSQTPGDEIIVGAERAEGIGSAFVTDDGGDNWYKLGAEEDPLDEYDVLDIETLNETGTYPLINAGTENGIYGHAGNWDNEWTLIQFEGLEVPVLESIDGWDDHNQIAAVITAGGWKLYHTSTGWDDSYEEIMPNEASFNKEVRDIAAVYWYGDGGPVSCYVATDEGLYLIDIIANDLPDCDIINLGTHSTLGYPILQYDLNFVSVDYHFEGGSPEKASILASTPYNVYEIVETRDNDEIIDVEISEIVEGTYNCNVIAPSLPGEASLAQDVFVISENGLIKHPTSQKWFLKGFAFEDEATGLVGTDIASDFDDPYTTDVILASSKNSSGGTIMFSSDGGETWENKSPTGDPKINAVDLDLVSGDAFAAGEDESNVWFSDNSGQDWSSSGNFTNAVFNDIYSDPQAEQDDYVYAAGSGNVKAQMYNGSSWSVIENGLSSVSDVFQFAKSPNINALYAATDLGVYKANLGVTPPAWTSRTNGTGAVEIGTVVCDPNNPYALLAATSPDAQTPHIWASGDSGRSWIDLPLGDIPSGAHINRLAVSQDENSGFAVGTDEGVFILRNIFRAGTLTSSEEWGPGVIVLTGDVVIFHNVTVTINSPCTIYAPYDFDSYGQDEITYIDIVSSGTLETDVTGGGEIIFTSSRPSNPQPGDWQGIYVAGGGDLRLSNCVIEYAKEAIVAAANNATLYVHECEINDPKVSGITASKPDTLSVWSTTFNDNVRYSISVEGAGSAVVSITEVAIEGEFDEGILYYGYSGDNKIPTIEDVDINNVGSPEGTGILISDDITGAPQGEISHTQIAGMECGIYITGSEEDPVKVGPDVHCDENDWAGIVVQDAIAYIEGGEGEGNSFAANEVGITGENSDGKVRWTELGKNDMGGELYECSMDFGKEEGEDPGMNSFEDDETYFLYVINESSAEDIYAQYNWWGTTNLNEIYSKVTEYVIVEPILTSAPSLSKVDTRAAKVPNRIRILNAYPNPFNADVLIEFSSPRPAFVSLEVYNILGQEICEIYNGFTEAGTVSAIWDGRDRLGGQISSGVYFCIARSGDKSDVKKLMLLK
jgi:photosystem II stability/assembly factor-like uncharacterized protein